jgi:hypothetical protein
MDLGAKLVFFKMKTPDNGLAGNFLGTLNFGESEGVIPELQQQTVKNRVLNFAGLRIKKTNRFQAQCTKKIPRKSLPCSRAPHSAFQKRLQLNV